jgi:PAS domain S-box-containing protein
MSASPSREHLVKLLDSSLDAFCTFDAGGRFVQVSRACRRIWGFEPEELLGTRYIEKVHPDDQPRTLEASHNIMVGIPTRTFENRYIRKDGAVAHVMWSAQWSDSDQMMYTVARDVTEKHRVSDQLRQREELLRIAGHTAKFGGWLVELATGMVHWSDEVSAIHELPDQKSLNVREALRFYPHPWRRKVRAAVDACIAEGRPFDMEAAFVSATGRQAWVRTIGQAKRDKEGKITHVLGAFQDVTEQMEAEARMVRLADRLSTTLESITDAFVTLDGGWHLTFLNRQAERLLQQSREELLGRVMWEAFPGSAGSVFEQQYRHAVSAQTAVHFHEFYQPLGLWLDVSAYPIEEGLAVHLQDVTERKRMEAQLAQAQKMESVGRLAGGIAHDFNNLLSVILGYTEVAMNTLPEESQTRADLEQVKQAGDRASELTKQLLSFARRQIVQPQVIDVNDQILTMQKLLGRLIGEHIALEHELAPGPERVRIDRGQLEQVLLNLVVNARDAMPSGGRIQIGTRVDHLEEEYTRLHPPMLPGPHVRLWVRDNGEGIAPEALPHVFEPFFTTKEVGQGTGLGLATCYGVVTQAGGHIWVESAQGQGTTFQIYLPAAADAQAPVAAAAAPVGAAQGGSERVLVVEDEALVRELATRALRAQGYAVLVAETPARALEIAAEARYEMDLLVTDMVMPGMSGKELAAQLTALNAGIKVLFVSGYAENYIVQQGLVAPGVHFLPKPFTPAVLAQKVRAVLDGEA